MHPKRERLRKRMWWSMYMRDQLIALGTRRPAQLIEEFDVPMLAIEDFQIRAISAESSCLPARCDLLQDVTKQRKLAIMCIEKAKLCICLSHILNLHYSISHNDSAVQEDESTRTTMVLMPRKNAEVSGLQRCDDEIRAWKEHIAQEAEYVKAARGAIVPGDECIILNMSMLHMVYFATISALHRPQMLSSRTRPLPQSMGELTSTTAAELVEISRFNLRYATNEITHIATIMSTLDLVKLMPTVGITVLLPAIITHLLDINAQDEAIRCASLQGFCQCVQIMSNLRDIHAAADYSTAFVEASIQKAAIALPQAAADVMNDVVGCSLSRFGLCGNDFHLHQQQQQQLQHNRSCLTPPSNPVYRGSSPNKSDDEQALHLNSIIAPTPPSSDGNGEHYHLLDTNRADLLDMPDFDPDFSALLNLDAAGEAFALRDASYMTPGGESGAERNF